MNSSFTMLAFAMAGLGVTPPEYIPPAPVPAAAYQDLDCGQLMRAAEMVDADLADAWDHQERLVRHRFGAPPPIVRRSEMKVARLKGELEAIWQVADRKVCGEATEAADLAWAPGREPGPMLGEPRERDAFEPDEPPFEEEAPMAETEPEPREWVEGPAEKAPEPPEVEGYGDSDPSAPAAWPEPGSPADLSAEDRQAPNGDIDRPAPEARPTDPVDRTDIPAARRL